MDAIRRYVFPIIWMLIMAVVAASLAKMAFFSTSAQNATDESRTPNAAFDEYASVKVTKSDISSTVELPATVRTDPGSPITATHAGEINKIWVKNGDKVAKGDPILQVRVAKDVLAEPAAPTPHDGADAVTEAPAPVATKHASADLPTSAAPVACDSPAIEEDEPSDAGSALPSDPSMPGMPGEPAASMAHLRCPVPATTTVVPGLDVKVTVDLGSAKGVLTVPTTAVEGSADQGSVFLLDTVGGEPAAHSVTLGLRGKDTVQVTKGLKEGRAVLRFVPGVDNPTTR